MECVRDVKNRCAGFMGKGNRGGGGAGGGKKAALVEDDGELLFCAVKKL